MCTVLWIRFFAVFDDLKAKKNSDIEWCSQNFKLLSYKHEQKEFFFCLVLILCMVHRNYLLLLHPDKSKPTCNWFNLFFRNRFNFHFSVFELEYAYSIVSCWANLLANDTSYLFQANRLVEAIVIMQRDSNDDDTLATSTIFSRSTPYNNVSMVAWFI